MKVTRFPLLWTGLLLMWLLLNGSVAPGHILLGAVVATVGCWAVGSVAPSSPRVKNLGTVVELAWLVIKDIVRSNIAVLGLIISGREARSAFVNIPLELTEENGLAILAAIVTATPGSAWIQHDRRRGVVTIHVLDTGDVDAWAADFKRTYEKRLVEILQ
jgi:multicomponent K+:H+ antiporter subunit E